LAGKKVKCPKCGGAIKVPGGKAPAQEEPEAFVEITCQCKKKFRVKASLSGSRANCPTCGQILIVPGAADEDSGAAGAYGFGDETHGEYEEEYEEEYTEEAVAKGPKEASPYRLLIILGGAAALIAAVLVALIVFEIV